MLHAGWKLGIYLRLLTYTMRVNGVLQMMQSRREKVCFVTVRKITIYNTPPVILVRFEQCWR